MKDLLSTAKIWRWFYRLWTKDRFVDGSTFQKSRINIEV
jgi:hypothetical protein